MVLDGEDTASLIFDKLYKVKIPTFATMSEEELNLRGWYGSGDMDVDKTFLNAFSLVYLNIAQIAELYKEGNTIKFTNPKDTAEVYTSIQKHLEAWHDYMEIYDVSNPPIDDLLLLERLADELYPIAVQYLPKDEEQVKLLDPMLSMDYILNKTNNKDKYTKPNKPKDRLSFKAYLLNKTTQVKPIDLSQVTPDQQYKS